MTIKELSIFVQNKKGKLAAISRLMGENEINIRAFNMQDTAEGYGIFRLIVDYTEKAREILQANHFTVSETEVAALALPDKPNALYNLLNLFAENGLNVEYIYAGANSVVMIKLDDPNKAGQILQKEGLPLINNTLKI
ncbi:MAG TPA: amino acid-binding protein [Spirochaetia bacterium]|nr:MAG: hypothetical protein A2Y41_05610 [Spirochaetes bacterium GWB1_36_13]HCL56756.1 amino acid-binding protein [Spirochaetia bacterium]